MTQLTKKLKKGLKGELLEDIQEKFCTDFGRGVQKTPKLVVRAACEEDIIHVLQTAGQSEIPVTIRGAGKSFHGQSLNEAGILLENFIPDSPVKFLENDNVEVNTRSRWHEVEHELNRKGRSIPVLTDYLYLSTGGTLSVGGIGVDSIRHGFQIDGLQSIRIIQADGTRINCSPTENQELFRFAPGGVGQAGFMDTAVLKTVPHRKYCYVYKIKHKSWAQLLDFTRKLSEDPGPVEHFNAWIVNKDIASEIGFYTNDAEKSPKELRKTLFPGKIPGKLTDESIQEDYRFKLSDRREAWLNYFPEHIRLWTDYVFDFDAFEKFMNYLEPLLKKDPLQKALQASYILLVRRPEEKTNFALAPAPPGRNLISVGLYCMVSKWNPVLLAATVETLRGTLEKCRDLGGRPYLYGWNDLDEGLKRSFYGADYERLQELRKQMHLEFFNRNSF